MRSSKRASSGSNPRQRKLAKALCTGNDLNEALAECGVTEKTFCMWMDDPAFEAALAFEQGWRIRRSQLLVCNHAADAVDRLVNLFKTDKGETARKACLDILELASQHIRDSQSSGRAEKIPRLSPEAAQRVLEALDA